MRPSLVWSAALVAAAAPCAAQVEARLDAAYAYVRYDGYLGSSAAALTPSLTWRSLYTTVQARGTFLAFESGNTSLQGLLTASTFSPSARPGRVELAAEAGGSDYAGVAQFAHAIGHARVHLMESRWGLWAGGLAGVVSSHAAASGASGVSAGAWGRTQEAELELSWTRVAIQSSAYNDWQARARWHPGALAIEGVANVRATRPGGTAAYGSASIAVRLAPWVELVLAGGSYPSDPVRGTIPGRFVSAGARLALASTPPLAVARRTSVPRAGPKPAAALGDARVAVERLHGQPVFVVYVTGAHTVEVAGDFTDWRPVALESLGKGRYRWEGPLPSGLQRFNLRLDGGLWAVPRGAALAADEFGGSVGVLVVP